MKIKIFGLRILIMNLYMIWPGSGYLDRFRRICNTGSDTRTRIRIHSPWLTTSNRPAWRPCGYFRYIEHRGSVITWLAHTSVRNSKQDEYAIIFISFMTVSECSSWPHEVIIFRVMRARSLTGNHVIKQPNSRSNWWLINYQQCSCIRLNTLLFLLFV